MNIRLPIVSAIACSCLVTSMTLPRAYADASRPIELPLQEWESPLTGGVPAGEQVSAVCPDGKCPYLGQLVYLPSQNAVDAPKGREFLKDLKIGGCVRIYDNDPRSRNEFSEFESMSAFTDHVSTESSIEGSRSSKILSMKASAKLTTNAESSTTNTFKSVVLDITVKKRNIDIEHNDTCLDAVNMTDRFLKGFSALPLIDSKNVTNGGDWKQYVDFLVDQGSHIITRLTTGARYQMWMSSSSKDEEALRKLKASACAEVEGVEAKKEEQNGVSPTGKACAEFDSTSRKKSKELSSKREIIVLGGGKDEFNALNVSRTDNVPPDPEILKAFIASADQGTSPVSFGYKPIWEALKYIYQVGCAKNGPDSLDCNNLQRAFTLQAAYDGYVAVGCDYRTAGKYAYQAMAVDAKGSNGINLYKCVAARTGCRSTDDDCHGFQLKLQGCHCFGPTCFDAGQTVTGTDSVRTKVKSEKGDYGHDEGANGSCSIAGTYCSCNNTWSKGLPERSIYRQAAE